MILIADSGSTKTDWRLIKENNEILSFETIGFNPYFISATAILKELANTDLITVKNDVEEVFFYGAGCSSEENCKLIYTPFNKFFTNAKIEIEHDMLAAARATFGRKKGIVGILGTGSNSCLYDGDNILENIVSLGYLLGDYGSGADIGKTFIRAFLDNELPKEIKQDFNSQYALKTNDILDAVYKKTLPNRFLAGFSLFVIDYLDHPYILDLVETRFELFFEKNICKYTDYQNHKLNLVGSVAEVYEGSLKKVAEKYNIEIGEIIKQPIDELVQYHLG